MEDELKTSENIDRTRIISFLLVDKGKVVDRIQLNPDRKLVYRRRVLLDTNGNMVVVYLAGWNDKSKITLNYIYPDGHIEMDDDRNDLILVDCEK